MWVGRCVSVGMCVRGCQATLSLPSSSPSLAPSLPLSRTLDDFANAEGGGGQTFLLGDNFLQILPLRLLSHLLSVRLRGKKRSYTNRHTQSCSLSLFNSSPSALFFSYFGISLSLLIYSFDSLTFLLSLSPTSSVIISKSLNPSKKIRRVA